jgi:hypothetical protein
VKIIISEKQLQKIQNHLTEQKNPLDGLNKYIEDSLSLTNHNTRVYLEDIHLFGDIDDVSIEAKVVKILQNDIDVTEFAKKWSIIDGYTSDDLPLGYFIKISIVNSISNIVKSSLPRELNEYDVVLHLY